MSPPDPSSAASVLHWAALIVVAAFVVLIKQVIDAARGKPPKRRGKRHHRRVRPDDWMLSKGKQIVGQPCASCGQKIAFDSDGCWCKECRTPLHREECERLHHLTDHGEEEHVGPYR